MAKRRRDHASEGEPAKSDNGRTGADPRFWKVLRQINAYVSNKWPLKLPCAYLNTQESRPTGTPLKRIHSG
ncbi:hypothetical protein T05_14962 [Trichinella murrelli]|uniref:Uncharacterized protein n=1 Tax=Trichinella murrelli TaxID=144512 RepID=A0A0V0UHE4_9BILA|nr:hypothetical protein T05_14962 [Trichinella murrelli]